jgi:hypothetical protein
MLGAVLVLLMRGTPPAPGRALLAQDSTDALESEEITVLASVLEAAYAPFGKGWVMVGGRTTTFACNPPAQTGLDVGGCSGMRVADETAEHRLAAVRAELPAVSAEMAANLVQKSSLSVVLPERLPTEIPQVMWAPGLKTELKFQGNPVFAAYMSRVGFDHERSKGLVYLGTMNWTDRSKSMGQYLLVSRQRTKWVVTDHAKVWG